jgi:hypothetical protein
MKPPPIRDQSESSQISQSQGFFSKLLGSITPLLWVLAKRIGIFGIADYARRLW